MADANPVCSVRSTGLYCKGASSRIHGVRITCERGEIRQRYAYACPFQSEPPQPPPPVVQFFSSNPIPGSILEWRSLPQY